MTNWCERFLDPIITNWPLLVAAIGGIVVAVYTLNTVKDQTGATRIAAEAAKKSADALIATERAWVMAQIDGDRRKWSDGNVHIVEGSGTSGDSTGTWIILSCHNEGKSPAWIYEKRVKFDVVPKVHPAPDFDSLPVTFSGREPIGIGQAAIPNVTKLHRLEIAKGHAKPGDIMIIYGIVRYYDIFRERRTATFGYQITEDAEGYTLERLTEAAYNENT
jgi:hypothetical protein